QGVLQDVQRVDGEVARQRDHRDAVLNVDQTYARWQQVETRNAIVDGGDAAGDRLLDVELGRIVWVQPIGEQLGDRLPRLVHLVPAFLGDQRDTGVGLRVEIHDQNVLALFLRKDFSHADRCRGLADAALQVDETQDVRGFALEVLDPGLDHLSIPNR